MDAGVDLNNISIFVQVVQAGSFSGAARQLGLPKSTVSRRITTLEERLGTRLLQRTTRTLNLSEAGRIYLEHCKRILAEVEASERAMSSLHEQPRGLLRVTAPLRFGFLAQAFAELLSRHPDLSVELVCSDRNLSIVDEGFDLAIRAGALEDSSLIARKLGLARLVLVASPAYLRRYGAPEHPSELEDHAGLLFGVDKAKGWSFTQGQAQLTVSPQPRLVANDFEVIQAAAVAGHGVAVLPEVLAAKGLQAETLRALLRSWSLPCTPLHVLYPSAEHLAPKVSALVNLLLEQTHGQL